ncbi:MAG: pimeloyl-ACP methyl ester carboxylesterase [Bacteroidia bacterium]
MNNHIYILSGLGADERVFSRIKFPENHTHLSWIENKSDESLQSYAARMAAKIEHSNPILIGLSFGGIVAQEIAAMIPVKELILISTIQNKKEKPWYFSQVAKLELVNYIPDFMLAKSNIFVAYAFSLNAKEDRTALDSCFDNTTAEHIKWAMKQIVNWEGVEYNTPTLQIHSRQDRIFRKEKSQAKSFISGGHFAVYTNADELNEVLVDRFK